MKRFNFSIRVPELRRIITGGKQKLPRKFTMERYMDNVPIRTFKGEYTEVGFQVLVTQHLINPHRKSSKHRIFILCPCGRYIPAGRINQHICK
jgi:hypothetical protein